ncbi:MAG: hypothetical protein KIG15_06185 [Coriobacteriales bacterium]|nr:hypothetical protein [Coriobacteriales bacterium]
MRNIARGHTGIWSSLRACALAAALACLLAGGAALTQPRCALADEPPAAAAPAPNPAFIGSKAARDIALDHAGLKKSQVSKVKVRLGRCNGKKAYLVKFYRKHLRYDYGIRAKNGKVMFYSARRP